MFKTESYGSYISRIFHDTSAKNYSKFTSGLLYSDDKYPYNYIIYVPTDEGRSRRDAVGANAIVRLSKPPEHFLPTYAKLP